MGYSRKLKKVNKFTSSNKDIQLILGSENSSKTKCEYEALSWESLRSKYENIFKIIVGKIL